MNAPIIYCHRVEIYTGKKRSYENDVYRVRETTVLAENSRYLILNDDSFTKLEKAKDKDWNAYCVFEVPSIDVHVDSRLWSDGVVFNLYASHEWQAESIKSAINRAIEKKCGWMKARVSFDILAKKERKDEEFAA